VRSKRFKQEHQLFHQTVLKKAGLCPAFFFDGGFAARES
jgi:hypothetical protein